MGKWFFSNGPKALVRHKATREVYEAKIVEEKWNDHYIFKIYGERAHHATVFCQSDDLEVDTEFEPWEVIKIFELEEDDF